VIEALRRIWKEGVMACYEVVSQHLPGMTEESESQDN
jgi:hypothetical protein